jgi:ornithine carbamoyltransferase
MANSLLIGCAIMGISISIGCPKNYTPEQEYIEKALEIAQKSGSKILITPDPMLAAKNARIIYSDVWASMGQEAESEARKQVFRPYQVNKNILSIASGDSMVLHCLPAHRGEEITEDIFEKHSPAIFEQAENRLHVQKAIMTSIM